MAGCGRPALVTSGSDAVARLRIYPRVFEGRAQGRTACSDGAEQPWVGAVLSVEGTTPDSLEAAAEDQRGCLTCPGHTAAGPELGLLGVTPLPHLMPWRACVVQTQPYVTAWPGLGEADRWGPAGGNRLSEHPLGLLPWGPLPLEPGVHECVLHSLLSSVASWLGHVLPVSIL